MFHSIRQRQKKEDTTLRRTMLLSVLTFGLIIFAGSSLAADPARARQQNQVQTQDQERIYGSQLMTPEERAEYRTKMRTATTEEEREQVRNKHRERIRQRAKEHGMPLPDETPARDMGRVMRPDGGRTGSGSGGMRPGGGRGR